MNSYKVYKHAPIALVAVEVRHSGTDTVTDADYAQLKRLLFKQWPVQRPGQDFTIDLGPNGPTGARISEQYQRYVSRDRTSAVAIRAGSTTIETVKYNGWEHLRAWIEIVLAARKEVSDPSGYERIGLRYLDEIRVPQPDDAIEWNDWVHSSLLSARPETPIELPLSEWQGMSTFGPIDGRSLVLRFGPRAGYAVEPNGELKRGKVPTGHFFLLDFDSFWETPSSIPEFEPASMVARCDDLHAPIRSMFEGLITNKLRNEVLDAE